MMTFLMSKHIAVNDIYFFELTFCLNNNYMIRQRTERPNSKLKNHRFTLLENEC